MLNKVMLIGNLGSDPELKQLNNDLKVASFSVATTEKIKDKAGAVQDRTEWHRISVWNKQAENCAKYLAKGSKVFIEGKIRTNTYEKDGEKRYSTEIMAQNVTFLTPRSESSQPQTAQQPQFPTPPDDMSDIPF